VVDDGFLGASEGCVAEDVEEQFSVQSRHSGH
jgi:hypothetical protein